MMSASGLVRPGGPLRGAPARGNRFNARRLPVLPGVAAESSVPAGPRHPLADPAHSAELRRRADEIERAFAAIEPALRDLAPHQFDAHFAARAASELRDRLGIALPPAALTATWNAPLDLRRLYARAVLQTFRALVERGFERDLAPVSDGERVEELVERWGFHAVDISPCADGRLSGVVDYILRVPPAVVVARRSYAGALFDVDAALRQWETIELRRWREACPNAATAPTRYLKIGVYHFSSVDPAHEGCAAHGSDAGRAARALFDRLAEFAAAVRQTHPGADVAVLAIGVDTDTDAVRVHVPDAAGHAAADRWVDNALLYAQTAHLGRDAAKGAIREAVAAAAGVAPDDARTAGMRWFCGYVLKNNIGQIDAVRDWHGGAYADGGHTERLMIVGDPADDVQLRNLAFQAQLDTVEEGAADLDVGIRIVGERHAALGLALPVLVHCRFDPRVPASEERARVRARRLRAAIIARCSGLAARGLLHVEAVVRAGDGMLLGVDAGASEEDRA